MDYLKTTLSFCKTDSIVGYKCPKWVKKKWVLTTRDFRLRVNEFFGPYSIVVYIYAEISLLTKKPPNFMTIDRSWLFEYRYLECDTAEERAFQFFKLNLQRYRRIVFHVTKLIITGEFSFPTLDHTGTQKRMAVYLWHFLDQEDKCQIVQKHFSEFYEFLLNSPGISESLIPAIEWYNDPTGCDGWRNRICLYRTAYKIKTSHSYRREHYRRMFQGLFGVLKTSVSAFDVLNFSMCLRHY